MKTYLGVIALLAIGGIVAMLGLSLISGGYWDEAPTGEEWCEMMMDKPNPDWSDSETRQFAKLCLYNGDH